MKSNSKKILNFFSKLLTVLAIVFIIFKIAGMDVDISQLLGWYIIAAVLFFGAFLSVINVLLRAIAWNNNLNYLSENPTDTCVVLQIYTRANLGKYLPGNVMHFVERNLYAAQIGLGQLETLTSTVFEIIGQCVAAVIIGAILSFPYIVRFIKQYVINKKPDILRGGTDHA